MRLEDDKNSARGSACIPARSSLTKGVMPEHLLRDGAFSLNGEGACDENESDEQSHATDNCDLEWLVAPFQPMGLEQLNAKAAMLNRLDNKYVVAADVLQRALNDLTACFDILEIDGKRQFTYDTCYFDDAEGSSYFDHHRGRRQRFKVRVRKYAEAKLCFVEVKLKAKRGITIKKRMEYEVDKYGTLDERAWQHIVSCYRELYGKEFQYQLRPVLEMRYKRVTLVAKEGGERMTIDCSLAFFGNGRTRTVSDNLFIVETKSSNGNGIADKILRVLHQHPTKRCSKYCVARAALQGVGRYNKFLTAMRKLQVVPPKESVASAGHSSQPSENLTMDVSAFDAEEDEQDAAWPNEITVDPRNAPMQ